MRQTKLWLTTIAMLLCSLAASAHDFEVDGIYYNITDAANLTVEVTFQGEQYNTYNEYNGTVIIPETVTYKRKIYRVTKIGDAAFRNCDNLTSITIPKSVAKIEKDAFLGCSNLYRVFNCANLSLKVGSSGNGNTLRKIQRLTALSSLTTDGDFQFYTFYGTHILVNYVGQDTVIVLPNSYKGEKYKIGVGAFYGCSSLTSITIPDGVTAIEDMAFHRCTNLASIDIPASVTEIGEKAFYNCSSLASITIPEGVTVLPKCTFQFCSSLKSLNLPESLVEIGHAAISHCYALRNLTIPKNVKVIDDYAFSASSGLASIVVPDGVTSIEDYAFADCSNLSQITLPESVGAIEKSAFEGCKKLTSITIPKSVTKIEKSTFYGCENLTSIVISDDVASIEKSAFEGCKKLTSITIPKSVTSIGMWTFRDCNSLASITIPESVTSIGRYAFSGCLFSLDNFINNSACFDETYWGATMWNKDCTGVLLLNDTVVACRSYVTEATIPEGVVSIEDEAFSDCNNLTSITIPKSVTSIGNFAFSNYNSLTSIIVHEENTVYDSRNECNAIIETSSNTLIIGCSATIIPEGVTSIGGGAFYGCSNLTSITIPESVTSIENNAFLWCGSLNSISVAEGNSVYDSRNECNAIIETSSNTLIAGCSATIIPESVESIGSNAFSGHNSLISITIPESVVSIGDYAFGGCDGLKEVIIKDGHDDLTLGLGGRFWTNSNTGSFSGGVFCGLQLETIYLGRNLTHTKGSTHVSHFGYCEELGSVVIGEDVTVIPDGAFYKCSRLTSVTIPKGVTSIGGGAFYGCSSLTFITCKAATPPIVDIFGTFNDIDKSIPVYVPAESADAYKAAIGWKDFTNIIGI